MARMHDDEVPTDADLVRRLLARQFASWADRLIRPVPSAGTDHALYRLGDDLAVRMPRIEGASFQVRKDAALLPRLAPTLPLAIPDPVAVGEPGEGYPWPWAVYRWLDGENADFARLRDPVAAARQLAEFLLALQAIPADEGPLAGPSSFFRGVPLAKRNARTLDALALCRPLIDASAAEAAWERALRAPLWIRPPVWMHGDLQPGNLLQIGGNLSAVIDFGSLAVGDPACDLLPAWYLFEGESRRVFRETLGVDDATWERGCGWALSVAVIALPYYYDRNPSLADMAARTIEAVLSEPPSSPRSASR